MALGRTHDFVNLLFLPPFLYFIPKEFYLHFTAGYLIGTFLLSPDLDTKGSKPSKRWGMFGFVWRPYQAKSKHRGLSHMPILGSFIRLTYLNFFVITLYLILSWLIRHYMPEYSTLVERVNPLKLLESFAESQSSFYFVGGILLSELLHVMLDLTHSAIGKRKRRV